MKKSLKLLTVVLLMIALIAAAALTASALKQDEVDTYLIYTPADLVEFASLASSNRSINVKLMADIDMTGVTYKQPTSSYYGTFDGNGHTISGLHRNETGVGGGDYGLLFNSLGNGYGEYLFGEVMNLTMKDCSINITSTSGEVFVGALCGRADRNDAYDISFENVDVTFNGTGNSAGALLAGISLWSSVRDECPDIRFFGITADADCSVTSTNNMAGGIIGKHNAESLYLHDIDSSATITSTNNVAGGIIGRYNVTDNPKFINITVGGKISGTKSGVIAGDIYEGRKTPIFAISNLTNKTALQDVVGWYESPTEIKYYDDVAAYGKAPKTDDGNFLISTADELRWFATYINGNNNAYRIRLTDNAILTNDIDMTDKAWTPMVRFRGSFDGQGHTISGIHRTVDNAAAGNYGILFDMLGNNYNMNVFGTVKNLTLADSSITVTSTNKCYVGGVAGNCDRSVFMDVSLKNVDVLAKGEMAPESAVAGFAGYAQFGADKGSAYLQHYFSCYIDADSSIKAEGANPIVGGIIGHFGNSECFQILDCVNNATMSGKSYVGGMVGSATSGGNRWFLISDSAFYGVIEEANVAAGIIAHSTKMGHVLDCTVNGKLNGAKVENFVGTTTVDVYTERCSDGSMAGNGGPITLYAQTRPCEVGHDLRVILLADMAQMAKYNELKVTISFYNSTDALVKSYTRKLSAENSDYTLYKTITAANETFKAEDGYAFFGNVITNIPAGAYSYFTVSVADDQNTPIVDGSTKKTETSLEGKTFYFLGSSVTYGTASNGKTMAEFIAERNNCTVVKDAVSGTTLVVSNDGQSYVQRLVNSSKFDKTADVDHFIVQLSTNDAGQNKPLGTVSDSYDLEDFDTTTIIGAMEYIICYIKTTWNCEVSFYTGTCYNNNLYVQMIAALYRLQEKWGIGLIDMFFDVEMNKLPDAIYNKWMQDSVHPKVKGYEYWWTPVFEEHLKSYDYE